MKKTPPKLRIGDKKNFEQLKKAFLNNDIALVSAIRKSDQQPVALLCAMMSMGTDIVPVPLATMITGNPYELYEDPTI